MRIVIDTNVIVSGLYNLDSPPGHVLTAAAEGRILLCAPESVRDELLRVLRDVLDYADTELRVTFANLPIDWIEMEVYEDHLEEARRLLRDPTDAPVLACALALGCDLVSGDADLHAVKGRGIRIWKPKDLVKGR